MKNALLSNWKLKILAVVLATLSYYVIRGKTSIEVRYDVPLEIQVDEGIAVLDQNPRTVQVTFRGSQEDLRSLDQTLLKAVVRLKATNFTGSEGVAITRRNIEGGGGVTVVQVYPTRGVVTFDREAEMRLPVAKPRIKGKPFLGRVELDYEPKVVTVRGPRRRLDVLELFTEPVDVEGRVRSFSRKVKVLAADEWISEIEPSEVTVTVSIVTDTTTRTWDEVPILAIVEHGRPVAVRFEPGTVSITVRGQQEILDSIPLTSVRAFVDCVGVDPQASYELPVNVHIPSQMDLSPLVEPETVQVIFGAEQE